MAAPVTPKTRIQQIDKVVPNSGEDVWRFLSRQQDEYRAKLNPALQLGTAMIQGFPVPSPTNQNDQQVVAWDARLRSFIYANSSGGGGATGTVGDTTHVPVIQFVAGLAKVIGVVPIAFPASNVPSGTRLGQAIFWNGSAWTLFQFPDNIELPPNSAGQVDLEFNETNAQTLPGKVTLDTGVAYGTVHPVPFSTVAAGNCVFDLDSDPGILIVQNANDGVARGMWQDVTTLVAPATNHEVVFYLQVLYGTLPFLGATGDQTVQFFFTDGASKTNFVQMAITTDNAGQVLVTLSTQANPSIGTSIRLASVNLMLHSPLYLCFHSVFQSGSTIWWYPYLRFGRSRWTFNSNGPLVSTVAMTRMYVRTVNTAAGAPTPQGFGFIRSTIGSPLPQGA